MERSRLILGKSAKSSELIMPEIIAILFILMVMVPVFVFIKNQSNSSSFYEELYAKKIGLAIDSGRPGTEYLIDVSPAWVVVKEQGLGEQWFKDRFVEISDEGLIENNAVIVHLSNSGGYTFYFFSDYTVKSTININEDKASLLLVLEKK